MTTRSLRDAFVADTSFQICRQLDGLWSSPPWCHSAPDLKRGYSYEGSNGVEVALGGAWCGRSGIDRWRRRLLGVGGAGAANESTIVNITPVRVLDTRDPVNVGLPGPFVSAVSQKLQITGAVPTTAGTQSPVPTGATGVLLNVTAVSPTANGFISVRPGDATGAPATSSLNVNAGSNVPNAVQVALPTAGANAGKIDITWDAYGVAGPTTEILVDIVGYTTNKGLQELVADVANLNATKANAADVYTKAQAGTGMSSEPINILAFGGTEHRPGRGHAQPAGRLRT